MIFILFYYNILLHTECYSLLALESLVIAINNNKIIFCFIHI